MATKKKTARKKAPAKRASKPTMSDQQLAQTFSRAVAAGNKALARKLARELGKRTKYGIYSSTVSVNDLRAFEALTKPKRRK